jgi:hypothetical protein
MVCYTKPDVWNMAVDDITMDKGEMIVSVIKNLICDAIVDVVDPEIRRMTIEDVVESFMAQIKKFAQAKPVVKFALAMPMMRP